MSAFKLVSHMPEINSDHEELRRDSDSPVIVNVPKEMRQDPPAANVLPRAAAIAFLSAGIVFLIKKALFPVANTIFADVPAPPITVPVSEKVQYAALAAGAAGVCIYGKHKKADALFTRRALFQMGAAAAGAAAGAIISDATKK